MLTAESVGLDYRNGGSVNHAVDGVSLSVDPGSFLGVIGPSGSGKSSLMYLLSGMKRPSRGRLVFEAREYTAMRAAELMRLRRRRFGFVFQQHFLINYLNVFENVLVGAVRRDHATAARAHQLLGQVGLGDKLRKRPFQLSIGERQRVAVVRALVHQPVVVFADEPTASLDQATGRQVVDVLGHFRQETGGAVVVVTHDPDMLTGADRILHMRDGRLN
jgi:putative ABC transport system ATP-binding protein